MATKLQVTIAASEDFNKITSLVKAIATKYMLKVMNAQDNNGEFVYTLYKKDKRSPFEFEFYVTKVAHGYKIDPVLIDPESTRQLVLTNVMDFFYLLKRKLLP
jgi:hypothetical protein